MLYSVVRQSLKCIALIEKNACIHAKCEAENIDRSINQDFIEDVLFCRQKILFGKVTTGYCRHAADRLCSLQKACRIPSRGGATRTAGVAARDQGEENFVFIRVEWYIKLPPTATIFGVYNNVCLWPLNGPDPRPK